MRSLPFQGGNVTPALSELPDGELLSRYVKSADGASFAAFYERHKQMVLTVCKRILRHRQDAEGALQETFLVLMRKAAETDTGEPITNWLYGAAKKVARNFRRRSGRRRAHESNCGECQLAQPIDEAEYRESFLS